MLHQNDMVDGQFQSRFRYALEDCSDVFDELFRCICGYADIVNSLRALICFDD